MAYDRASNGRDMMQGRGGMQPYGYGPDPNAGMGGTAERLVRGLGWFSLALGLAQLFAPRAVAERIGLDDKSETHALLQVVGLRELMAGFGILRSQRPTGWLWSRVAGDAMDLALLGNALSSNKDDDKKEKLFAATASVLGIAALDFLTSRHLSGASGGGSERDQESEPELSKYVTVMRPVDEVYAFWRDFQNLPRFMSFLESVNVAGDGRSHWVARAPLGRTVEWDAELVSDVPNQHIAWRSLPGADIENSGEVRFNPAPRGDGTEVRVDIRYSLPGGKVAETLSHLFPENPQREVYDDLRAFKQVMETGEVVMSDALAGGSRLKQHPAQPLEGPPESR